MSRNRLEIVKERFDVETYWQWESKICEQEITYYENLLRDLKRSIDSEIEEKL